MVKRKVSLGGGPGAGTERRRAQAQEPPPPPRILEMFFNTGVIFHEVALPEVLPDVISSFIIVKDEAGRSVSVRVAG
ncbi:MAG: hypothetical protein RIF41_35005, partial [Polyangiaceae bacterium]